MEKFKLNINGKEVKGLPGQTILEVARENDIFIPTLCYDERTKIYGSCGICMCEVEGNPKLCKACATVIAPGMVIRTNTERVIESRKTNLELLLSNHTGDCRPPCLSLIHISRYRAMEKDAKTLAQDHVLTAELIERLIERIEIDHERNIHVTFRFKNEFQGKAVEPCTTM